MRAQVAVRGLIASSLLAGAALMGTASVAVAGPTLDAVKARGELVCGVHTGLYGFSAPDDKGVWRGIDVDVCRAVAAAVFGDDKKVKYVPLSAQARLTALQSGEIDLLSRNTTWTLTRETANGLNFSGVNYYDGQGFMVPKKAGVTSAKQLSGATVCVQTGTTTELNLADYFRANKMDLKPVTIEKYEEVTGAFIAGRCDAITSDASQLAAVRANDTPNPADYLILPELISKEPLGPAVRQGDDQWFDVVKWALFAMLDAEERGLTAANLEAALKSPDPNVQRLLGVTGDLGKGMGLDNKWAYNIIKQVGNYGESFERNVGMGSKLQLPRGLNAQWTNGGLMYAPPIR
jgi:general L-amino acid transport system substrate-binding protein